MRLPRPSATAPAEHVDEAGSRELLGAVEQEVAEGAPTAAVLGKEHATADGEEHPQHENPLFEEHALGDDGHDCRCLSPTTLLNLVAMRLASDQATNYD
jgi:hypothetical protein